MKIRFVIGGTEVSKIASNCIPSVGDRVTISMDVYRKGLYPGSVITFTVNEDFPPHYDFSEPDDPVVSIDVDNYIIVKKISEEDA